MIIFNLALIHALMNQCTSSIGSSNGNYSFYNDEEALLNQRHAIDQECRQQVEELRQAQLDDIINKLDNSDELDSVTSITSDEVTETLLFKLMVMTAVEHVMQIILKMMVITAMKHVMEPILKIMVMTAVDHQRTLC